MLVRVLLQDSIPATEVGGRGFGGTRKMRMLVKTGGCAKGGRERTALVDSETTVGWAWRRFAQRSTVTWSCWYVTQQVDQNVSSTVTVLQMAALAVQDGEVSVW